MRRNGGSKGKRRFDCRLKNNSLQPFGGNADFRSLDAWANHKVKSHFWRNYNQSELDYIELKQGQLDAFEMKWNTSKNHKVTRAFTNAYPDATTEVITPINFVEFCGL